jgi:hypothetical protein
MNNNNNNDDSKNNQLSSPSSTSNNSSTTSKSARDRGIYARPSFAIERGSGFFIPGLEGSRIRFVFGLVVLLLDGANHFSVFGGDVEGGGGGIDGSKEDYGMIIAEILSAFYGALLVLQGSIDFFVERSSGSISKGAVGSDNGENGSVVISDENNGEDISTRSTEGSFRFEDGYGTRGKLEEEEDDDGLAFKKYCRQISRAIVAYTPATEVRLVSEEFGVLYSFGIANANGREEKATVNSDDQKRWITLCLDAVSSSRGGSRVALPSDHPSSKLLPVDATRCILVQKVDDYHESRTCIIVGSDKILPSFTKNDLRWLGQLAQYNNLISTKW